VPTSQLPTVDCQLSSATIPCASRSHPCLIPSFPPFSAPSLLRL
jgi:hypothetical protein